MNTEHTTIKKSENGKKLLSLLNAYVVTNVEQGECSRRIVRFVEGNSECFEAKHPPMQGQERCEDMGHVTGSAWVLSPDKKHVLLTHHKKLNKWLQLGGHSDGESDVILTSLREAKEESGIDGIVPLSQHIFDIDIHKFPKKKNVEAHMHYDIRFCLQASHTDFTISEESHNLKWIPLSEIKNESFEESICRMARKTDSFLENLR